MPHAEKHLILAVHITDRIAHVDDVQKVLTEYGRYIKTRLGLHETSSDYTSPNGLLLLELIEQPEKNPVQQQLSTELIVRQTTAPPARS